MSEFKGGSKVRCVDCTRLEGNRCSVKDTKVAPRKRRVCGSYQFTGEFQNRTSPESVYMPYVDKNTQRMIKRLMKLGITPVASGPEGVPEGYKRIPMPQSTATAGIVGVREESDPLLQQPGGTPGAEPEEEPIIWTPDDEQE